MLGIALSLLFVSAAPSSSTLLPPPIPLWAPLPNGTLETKVNCSACRVGIRGCCSNNEILYLAIAELCGVPFASDSVGQAYTQYGINYQIALCNFDGHSAINVQLLLTQNASAILDRLIRPDEQLRQQQAIYRALQIIGGHIGLPILILFSIFSKTAQRDLTFLNFCFTWIFSSITFSLGLYRLGPAIPFGLTLPFIHSDQECLNQAAFVSGAQVMTDTAMCALIVQLWFDFRAAIHGPRSPRQIRWTKAMLLAVPYVALLAFSLPALGASVNFLGSRGLFASQMNFYCMLLENNTFLIFHYTVLLTILIVTLIVDACVIHILYRRWWFFQQTGGKAIGVPLSVAVRVVIFCAYRLVIAVAYVATMLNTQGITVLSGTNGPDAFIPPGISVIIGAYTSSLIPVWVNMLQAGTPLIASLIFGMSKEFLDALMLWRLFNPILATSICRHRRSPVTPRESNVGGEVVDDKSVVSRDSILDIRQETKGSDGCLAL
ncbi:hypothetical protein JB92DRAFT_2946277 [Gautieria morchelliformis]|nr:hypothetical protein JB92DRAFT_2946277 [Gautieria morchelliformis]